MKVFRSLVITLFLLVTGVYVWFHFNNQAHRDESVPFIRFDSDVLQVSVDAVEADLLQGVHAYDEKDGDLSDRVIIEKSSNFVEKGLLNITYAVVDNDRHTVKATRRVHYTDYKSPRFSFKQAMRFEVGSDFNILKVLGANDMIDGNISDRIKLTGSDLSANVPGIYRMQAQVTNSRGDVGYLRFNVTMVQAGRPALELKLREYLIYVKMGGEFNPDDLFLEVAYDGQPLTDYDLELSSSVDLSQPGMYSIRYLARDQRDMTGETELVVIVEE